MAAGNNTNGETAPAGAGATSFDKAQFARELRVLALRVPLSKIGSVRAQLQKADLLLRTPKVRPIVSDPTSTTEKLILLTESLPAEGAAAEVDGARGESLREIMGEHALPELVVHTETLRYEHLGAFEVLRQLLPREVVGDIPTSFETVGHIAHLNLKDEQLPYKALIGRVILEKNDRIATVVNKTQAIENQFRVLPLEVIAGKDEMETMVIQHGIRYKLNYAQVYVTSTLTLRHPPSPSISLSMNEVQEIRKNAREVAK